MLDRAREILEQASPEISAATSSAAVEELRVRYLGRKAELPQMLRGVSELPAEERGPAGKALNEARRSVETAVEARADELEEAELVARLERDRVDVTLPGDPVRELGRLHLVSQTRREI